jgi:hypothetical protein
MRRAELLAAEDEGWRTLHVLFERLRPEDWERSGASGDSSAKDLLAHIACWHAEATAMLESLRSRGDESVWPADVDAFNRDAYERCRDMTLREVQAMAGAARHRFREETALGPDPVPDRLAERIASCAHGHYDEHLAEFAAFA